MGFKDLIDKKEGSKINSELFERYLNMCMSSTMSEEFYSKKDDQTKKSLKLHNEMFEDNRELYALSTLLPINDIHKAVVVKNLVKNINIPAKQKDFENNLILNILNFVPTNRAYKILEVLIKNKINNARVRWVMRQFIRERRSLNFEAVKYKRVVKQIFRHSHINTKKLKIDDDVWRFLFEKEQDKISDELFKNYFKASKDKEAVFKLPYSVAEGFKNLHKISDKDFMEGFKGKLTKGEQRRVQRRAEKAGVKIDLDLSGQTPVNILKFLRAEGRKSGDVDNFEKACKKEATKLFEYFQFENIKVVLDNSGSMFGSEEKKFHPISVGEAVANVLKYLSDNSEIVASPNTMEFLSKVTGESNIADGILKALENIDLDKDNLIVIISDAFENAPAGLSNQILTIFKKKLDKKEKTIIIHLNPVFAPEAEDIKKLSEVCQTFGIRSEKQLFLILMLAIIRNKKDKKIRQIINGMKQKVQVRPRKKKKNVQK